MLVEYIWGGIIGFLIGIIVGIIVCDKGKEK